MPRREGNIERQDSEGEHESLPSDYQTGKMQRGRKKRKGFKRRGRDGKIHTVEAHYQRYWYGGKNFGARPVMKDIEDSPYTPQTARKRYVDTSTLRQRLLDNKQKADQKREPVFGRDEGGDLLLDPLSDGNVAIHPDEWFLWTSQPNQYDIAKVDEPLPKDMHFEIRNRTTGETQSGRSISDFDINPLKESQELDIYIFKNGRKVGDLTLDLDNGNEIGRRVVRRSTAEERNISQYSQRPVSGKPHLVSVPIYNGWRAVPVLGVGSQRDRGKGYATFLIREAFDLGDRHDMQAMVSASPSDYGISDPVEMKASQAWLRSMYTSFGLKADRSMKDIMEDPSETIDMTGIPYSQREGKIIQGRVFQDADGEITAIHIDPSIHPQTAEYNQVPRKNLEPRPYETTGINVKVEPDGRRTRREKTIQINRRP